MKKKDAIMRHELLQDMINVKGLIEAQASMPTFMGVPVAKKENVKTFTKGFAKKVYRRT